MSYTDPTEYLETIISLYQQHHIPKIAYDFAVSALNTATSIISTIDEMEDEGYDATDAQLQALENITNGAKNWLKRKVDVRHILPNKELVKKLFASERKPYKRIVAKPSSS